MGTRYGWKCTNCDYSLVMSGGKDCGMTSWTHTFLCKTCKELMDVEVSHSEWNTEQWERHYCEECNSLLELWNTNKKPCPSCGSVMIIDDFQWIEQWD